MRACVRACVLACVLAYGSGADELVSEGVDDGDTVVDQLERADICTQVVSQLTTP